MARSQQPAATPGDAAPARPVSVLVAVVLLALLAGLLLVSAVLTLVGRETVVDSVLAAQPDVTRAEVDRLVLISTLRDLVLGLLAGASAWAVSRRRAWGRWSGLAVAVLLGLFTFASMVAAGGLTAFSLLAIVLCIGAASSLLAGTTAAWAPGRRRRAG